MQVDLRGTMMKKKSAIFLSVLVLLLGLSGCGEKPDPAAANPPEQNKIQVTVTFDALKEFVSAVAKDKVEIVKIIPDGIEPHDFEPKAQDLKSLTSSKVFVYNGLGMESWVGNAIEAVQNDSLIVTDASEGIVPISNEEPEEIKEHGQYDPHIWLSIKGAEIELNNIKNALIEADPENKDYYEKNCSDYTSRLESLFTEYSAKFQGVEKKYFVTGHAAFSYLCRDFGLQQNSVEDVFAEGEPSAQQLSELVDYCKENKVTTIFAEELASPEISQTLATEVGAEVKTIYTMESSEGGKSYLDRMEDNLNEIYESLK